MTGSPKRAAKITALEAASLVKSDMWLDYGVTLSQPDVFDTALAARASELRDIKIRSCLSLRPRAFIEVDPGGEHFRSLNWHFSGYDRVKHDAGCCTYVPLNLGEVPDYYRRFIDPPDIAILKTCAMDENGVFNFGPTNAWHRAVVETAKVVMVETSPAMPYVFGDHNGVHASEVDFVIDGNTDALPELHNAAMSDVDRKVAHLIAGEIEDGACIQVGIGAMPNAACSLLVSDSNVKDLGIHTEMLTDGIIDLVKAGRVTGTHKKLNPGKVVFTFALGSSGARRIQPQFRVVHRGKEIRQRSGAGVVDVLSLVVAGVTNHDDRDIGAQRY